MPTSKSKKPAKKSASKLARPESGPVPPYGEAIRGAVARGNVQEMRKVAVSARKFIQDAEAALQTLDKRIKALSPK